ncbi:MAG: sodium:solute symporter [Bacteroidaceae bacterium]|nr:sodium:solute symporter [Bacteroidaceae bacterium]
MLIYLITYFLILYIIARFVGSGSNDAFFRGNRNSPWPVVAFGMIGASISGVSFVGVPGWVTTTGMTYLQMCLGFIVGYIVVAFVLLPIYYRYNLTSIYTYLSHRLGRTSYKTGASFFIVSKLLGAAAKFYVVVQILQLCIADKYGIPYVVTATLSLLFIWLYTHRSGIKSLVWTDAIQTLVLLVALVLIIWQTCHLLGFSVGEAVEAVWNDPKSQIFEFDSWASRQNFWKQFLSGAFVVIVMTGLDQDMMQKNLTCKDLRSAQKDMCSYGIMFVPVNLLLLSLGILLVMLYGHLGIPLPAKGDSLLTDIVLSGQMGQAVITCFVIGMVASTFSTADSALTALTTSVCVDIIGRDNDTRLRRWVHIAVMAVFLLCTLAFHYLGNVGVMDLIYTLVSYTYGPLLGLFAFCLFTRRRVRDKAVPYICIMSPLICLAIDHVEYLVFANHFGYEMLMFNGMLTFAGLWMVSRREKV